MGTSCNFSSSPPRPSPPPPAVGLIPRSPIRTLCNFHENDLCIKVYTVNLARCTKRIMCCSSPCIFSDPGCNTSICDLLHLMHYLQSICTCCKILRSQKILKWHYLNPTLCNALQFAIAHQVHQIKQELLHPISRWPGLQCIAIYIA